MLYTDLIWEHYVEKVEKRFRLKTYAHFDPYFNFPRDKHKIKHLVIDSTGKRVAKHPFLPLVKILIKTPRFRFQEDEGYYDLETKIRPISFASHFDTYIYGFYAFALNEIYQKYIRDIGFSDCVLAYRNDLGGRCNIQFAKEVFDIIKEKQFCSVIALDIKGYFDSIDHKILKEKWCKILNINELPDDQYKIYQSLTKYSYVNKNSFLRHFNIDLDKKRKKKESWQSLLDLVPDDIAGGSFKDKFDLLRKKRLIVRNKSKNDKGEIVYKGIPQGSSMSALLSNVYLIDFDSFIFRAGIEMGFTYRRYCDDILLICPTEKVNEIMKLLITEINEKYYLRIQDKKTEVIDFTYDDSGYIRGFSQMYNCKTKEYVSQPTSSDNYKNLQYLGFEFNGRNSYIRPASLSRYFRKMKGRIVKTIMMAYSKKSKSTIINKRQIYHRYSHLGRHNFLKYAYNASKKYYKNSDGIIEGMDSASIRRQLSSHFRILDSEIIKTSAQRAKQVGSIDIKK